MTLEPQTTVVNLLRAIPSSAAAFQKLGISTDRSEAETLEEACSDHGVRFEEFLWAMDEIDWSAEYASVSPACSDGTLSASEGSQHFGR